MDKTRQTVERCVGAAGVAFPATGGPCSAEEAGIYLAHTGEGESVRAIAQATGRAPSAVLRTVRRIESRREDPLVGHMLNGVEARLNGPGGGEDGRDRLPRAELEREARRYLRRLCEPGAFLLVTRDASTGGIFCRFNAFRRPIAMLPLRVAVAFLREGWVRRVARGAQSVRYRITDEGRSALKRLIAEDAARRHGPTGFAEAPTPFAAQHQLPGARRVMDPVTGEEITLRVNLGEDPLGWLARRKGRDGKPFLAPAEVEAGERLRLDFELAQMGPSVAQDWRRFLVPNDRLSGTPRRHGPGEGPAAARARVAKALDALGPGLADAALRVCCFLEGLEACERRMGWSARSGKVAEDRPPARRRALRHRPRPLRAGARGAATGLAFGVSGAVLSGLAFAAVMAALGGG